MCVTKVNRRRFLLQGVAVSFVAATRLAWAAADPALQAPVRKLITAMLAIMRAGQATPFEQRAGTLGPVIDQAFDLETILHESIGPAWASLPADQQAKLTEAFRQYTVASYVQAFDSFNGQRFDVLPDARAVGNGDQVVQTTITRANGEVHALDYVMHQEGEAWRVVDVLADGTVSRVAVQRSDFRRLLARGGGEALVESLRSKAHDLAKT